MTVKTPQSMFGRFHACYLGFFLLFGFMLLSSSGASAAWPEHVFWLSDLLPVAVRIVAFLVVALSIPRFRSILELPHAVAAGSVAMSAGTALFALASSFPMIPLALPIAVVGLVASNAAFSFMYLAWMELYSRMGVYRVLLYFSAANMLSSLFSFGLSLLGASSGAFAIVVFAPVASAALLRKSVERLKGDDRVGGEEPSGSWSISVRPLLVLMIFSFASSFIRPVASNADIVFSLAGALVAGSIVIACVCVRLERFEVKTCFQLSVSFVVAGALGLMLDQSWASAFGAFASNAGTVLFMVFVTAIFANAVYRFGVNSVWLFGIAQAGMAFGTLIARALWWTEASLISDPIMWSTFAAFLIFALVSVSMFLVGDRGFQGTWGIKRIDRSEKGADAAVETLDERCRIEARRYSLTAREEEILLLMAQGHSLVSIGKRLFVAESTMKTHSRHIYRKFGVANKQELLEHFESQG